jgi:hypothetical protein
MKRREFITLLAKVAASASKVGHLRRSSRYAERPMHAAMIANPGTCSIRKISAGLSRSLCQVLIHQRAKTIGPRMMPASTVRADNTPYLMRKMVRMCSPG